MKLWCLVWAFVIGACALSGCAQSRGPSAGSSETHFLLRCDDDSCGQGLRCICGACSKACSSDTSCSDLASAASCVKPEDGSCQQSRSCDVECKVNADCAQLSGDHKCEAGRCRAIDRASVGKSAGKPTDLPCDGGERCPDGAAPPRSTGAMPDDAGASGAVPMPADCQLQNVAAWMSPAPQRDCGTVVSTFGAAPSKQQTLAANCARDAADANQPFTLYWTTTDGYLVDGLIGVTGPNGFVVNKLQYLSDGTVLGDHATSWWSPCTLPPHAECDKPVSDPMLQGLPTPCLQCEAKPERCRCFDAQLKGRNASVSCDAGLVLPVCPEGSCMYDFACYPEGATSGDGCCTCEQGKNNCVAGDSCPDSVLIGRRCDVDADCSLQTTTKSDLVCRTDLFGGRGVCTRDCGVICPIGTECLAEIPDNQGGTVANACMLQCTLESDCATGVGGAQLGSSCETHGDLIRSYCF